MSRVYINVYSCILSSKSKCIEISLSPHLVVLYSFTVIQRYLYVKLELVNDLVIIYKYSTLLFLIKIDRSSRNIYTQSTSSSLYRSLYSRNNSILYFLREIIS